MEFLDHQEAEKSQNQKVRFFFTHPLGRLIRSGYLLFSQVKGRFIKNLVCVLLCGFLGFLGVQKFHLGHFSTALSAQISKMSTFLMFGEKLAEILHFWCIEGIFKLMQIQTIRLQKFSLLKLIRNLRKKRRKIRYLL